MSIIEISADHIDCALTYIVIDSTITRAATVIVSSILGIWGSVGCQGNQRARACSLGIVGPWGLGKEPLNHLSRVTSFLGVRLAQTSSLGLPLHRALAGGRVGYHAGFVRIRTCRSVESAGLSSLILPGCLLARYCRVSHSCRPLTGKNHTTRQNVEFLCSLVL